MDGILINEIFRIIILAYADDLVLFALDSEKMKLILEYLELYCSENSLRLNTDKTKVVIFKKGDRNYKKLEFRYANQIIEIVKSYSYLGVIFDSSCSMNLAAGQTFNNVSAASSETVALIYRAKLNDWIDVLKL